MKITKKITLTIFLAITVIFVNAQHPASWMRDAKWGVMIHYQPEWLAAENQMDSITIEKWNDLSDIFDCEAHAKLVMLPV